jgi:hypothetical protein
MFLLKFKLNRILLQLNRIISIFDTIPYEWKPEEKKLKNVTKKKLKSKNLTKQYRISKEIFLYFIHFGGQL